MAKKINYKEVTHQWEGTAIVRQEGELTEVNLGVVLSDKKLKEVGAKELFTNLPEGTITVEVKKISDSIITYELDSEVFKTHAKVVETGEQHPSETTAIAEGEAVEQ